ncbi:exo-beta-N-acetylmuramidase NamZ family protein [Fictibacillus sp. NRS-1165]|uniref:exo-beta-N-acetylmuramidase NamZ family protein n=1 Tax=Fictibacillus sp. NRS-1165 TaxID=3144463 RepID=UPI003D22A8CF
MKKWLSAGMLFVLMISLLSSALAKDDNHHKNSPRNFKTGVEVLLQDQQDLLKGKRVGLITNPTGVDGKLNSIVDAMHNNPNFELKALYGPEHGVRGSEQAGSYVDFYIDKKTGLPVYSLYGKTKKPTPEMLNDIDVLVFDIQDVGTRFYTYIYTMAYAMEAAKENNIEFVVLDRPNPLGGEAVEGPVLEPKYATFVGLYPIPLRHGMTVGELAMLFNKEFNINADLKVVKMKGWHRWKTYYETPLQWVMPSPNMPTVDTAFVYPGAGLIEGTNVSEGRGTTRPFETIGAPFIDGDVLAQKLNELKLPGVMFRSNSFTPTFSKFANVLSNGVQIHVTDYGSYHSVDTGLAVVKTIHDLYPNDFQFRAENSQGISYFDNLIGNGWVREEIEKGTSLREIKKKWIPELEQFKKVRKHYLLYK